MGCQGTKRSLKEIPPSFLHVNGVVCSNTLFLNTSALTSSLLFGQILRAKVLKHLVWSNTCGFQFGGSLARRNFLSALCGLPSFVCVCVFFLPGDSKPTIREQTWPNIGLFLFLVKCKLFSLNCFKEFQRLNSAKIGLKNSQNWAKIGNKKSSQEGVVRSTWFLDAQIASDFKSKLLAI